MNRDINLLADDFKIKVTLFLNVCDNIFITDGFRTTADQQALYAKGRTVPGSIVTWIDGVTYKSNHQSGNAIDIAFKGDYLYPSDYKEWRKVADIAKAFGIEWGYDLWGVDKPHFQNDKTIPAQSLLKDYIMTNEQRQALQALEYACKNLHNICELQGGNKDVQEFASRTATESRNLNS